MTFELQVADEGDFVVLAAYELPGGVLEARRWVKTYPSRADFIADVERLSILPAQNIGDLRRFPIDKQLPGMWTCLDNPKQAFRTFGYFPIGWEH